MPAIKKTLLAVKFGRLGDWNSLHLLGNLFSPVNSIAQWRRPWLQSLWWEMNSLIPVVTRRLYWEVREPFVKVLTHVSSFAFFHRSIDIINKTLACVENLTFQMNRVRLSMRMSQPFKSSNSVFQSVWKRIWILLITSSYLLKFYNENFFSWIFTKSCYDSRTWNAFEPFWATLKDSKIYCLKLHDSDCALDTYV